MRKNSFTVRVGDKRTSFQISKIEIGCYFIAPGKKPRVEYGAMTDDDLLNVVKEYLGTLTTSVHSCL